MFAVAERGGRIRPQVAVVKALASALCIGGGGSVGREGPIVQIGSALGSRSASWCGCRVAAAAAGRLRRRRRHRRHLQRPDRRGVLRPGADPARLRGRVVRHGRPRRGHRQRDRPGRLRRPARSCTCPAFPSTIALRVPAVRRCSACWPAWSASAFIRVLYGDRGRLRPAVARAGVAAAGGRRGAARACCCWRCPQMYGVGYPVLGNGDRAAGTRVGFLLLLLVGKMLATSLTIGIGGSGGVFAPVAVHRGDARRRLRRRLLHARARASRRRPARTAWSAWARCSPARPVPRSPRC